MGSAILYLATSLDGFIAGKNDDISWLYEYDGVEYGFNEFFSGIGAIIQGRRAYDVEAQIGWQTPHPVPTFVLSHNKPEHQPQRSDVVFTDDDIAEVLRSAKSLTDKKIWIEGGAKVAQQFLSRGLLDEMVVTVAPVILGEGIRLFDEDGKRVLLSLVGVKQFEKGLVQLLYRPGVQSNPA